MSLIPCSKFCHFPLLHFPLSLLLPLYSVSLSGASYSTFSGNILLPTSLAPPLPTCTSYSTYSCSYSCTSFCTLFCTFFSTSLAFYYYDSFSSSSSSFSCSSSTTFFCNAFSFVFLYLSTSHSISYSTSFSTSSFCIFSCTLPHLVHPR